MSKVQKISGTIVVVAKCPIPGVSKTRLAKGSGDGDRLVASEHCHLIAKAMLSDVIRHVSLCPYFSGNESNVLKMIMYAPGSEEGKLIMERVLNECFLSIEENEDENSTQMRQEWELCPMLKSSTREEMKSSNLGILLMDALDNARKYQRRKGNVGGVVFLGMDCPEIPIIEILHALKCAENGESLLCPSDDGGYGMLGVPPEVDISRVFSGIRWSNNLTALSQLKALSDCGIPIRIGQVMRDIDEYSDLIDLANRLCEGKNGNCSINEINHQATKVADFDVLSQYSAKEFQNKISPVICSCSWTWKCLNDIGLIVKNSDGRFSVIDE